LGLGICEPLRGRTRKAARVNSLEFAQFDAAGAIDRTIIGNRLSLERAVENELTMRFSGKTKDLLLIMASAACLLPLIVEQAFAQQFEFACGSQKAANAFSQAEWIFQNAQLTHYKHNKLSADQQWQVGNGSCGMEADCSGFVSYVLYRVAPAQYESIRALQPDRPYPQAKIYASFFNSLSHSAPANGWIRIAKFSDLRRGDIIAWEKNVLPGKRGNTGHVMFVVDKPEKIETIGSNKFVSIQVLDSSSVVHFAPETLPPNTHQSVRDGLGKGVVRLLLDGDSKPIGYWEGSFSGEKHKAIDQPTLSDNIGFGRLVDTYQPKN
jgi:hypothetical protein